MGNRPTTNPNPEEEQSGDRLPDFLRSPEGVTNGNQRAAQAGKWPVVPLSDLAVSMKNGIYKHASAYAEDGIPCLRMYNIEDGRIVWKDIKRMRLTDSELDDYGLLPGDLLVNRVNSRELVGKTAPIPDGLGPCVFESKNIRLRLDHHRVDPKWVSYKLLLDGSRYFERNAQQVVGMASINQGQLGDFPIPLPPLPEQRRIVARIEELFSRLDAGVAALRQAKAQLQRYRQSVLAAAVTGQLTQAWREQKVAEASRLSSPDKNQRQDASATLPYESAEDLLKRILKQRREQWNGRGEYSEPVPPTADQIRAIPLSWASTSVDAIALIGSGNTPTGLKQHEGNQAGDLPWFKVGDMNSDGNEVHMVAAETILPAEVAKKFGLKVFAAGTIIFPKRGGAILTGKKRILSEAACLDANTMGLTVAAELASYFWTWFLQIRLASLSDGSNVPQVNNKDILPLWVPLPPLAEQHQIVAEVEARTTAIDHLEAELDRQISRSNRLRQSALAAAFTGQL